MIYCSKGCDYVATTKAQQKAVAKYESKVYDKTLIRMPKGNLAIIKSAAEKKGESLNAYIIGAIEKRMEAEQEETAK